MPFFCTLSKQPVTVQGSEPNGEGTVLTWDPVEGATHYNLYWNPIFFGTDCTVTPGGSVITIVSGVVRTLDYRNLT